jgi:hypothetical protein
LNILMIEKGIDKSPERGTRKKEWAEEELKM